MKYFAKARDAALLSDRIQNHTGCIAIINNTVIGAGFNAEKTHPRQAYYNKYRNLQYSGKDPVPKIHAEIMCINSISKMRIDFSRVHFYIYRIRSDQPFGIARPCPACLNAIKDIGVQHIFYTTDDGYAHEILQMEDCL